jgi:hypothetical protein
VNRYAPVLGLTTGTTDVTDDLATLIADFSITDQVQSIEYDLSNLNDKYAFSPFNHILLTLDGEDRFYGRVDSALPDSTKEGAKILKVKGRQRAAASLEDIVASLQFVAASPHETVEGIIASYNTLKGSADPAVTITSNLAPDAPDLSVRWQRKSHWKMLQELQEVLGAPVAEGGVNEFFDFWVDPATVGEFYFENAGYENSGITILPSTEAVKAKRIVDGTTIKNDIWLWANSRAGRIPLEMQKTYPPAIADIWTEDNAIDYDLSGSPTATPSDHPEDWDLDGYFRVGLASLRIVGPVITGLESERITWKLQFPKAGVGVVWPAQDPGGHFNAYNEVEMSEKMGEMVACQFWIQSDAEFDIMMQCKDSADVYAFSPSYHYRRGWLPLMAGGWVNIAIPFGPSSTWSVVSAANPPPVFDWSDVTEIAWVAIMSWLQAGVPIILFDGLEFVKPLVVNSYDASAGIRRSHHVSKDAVATYWAAKLIAQGLLEQMNKAQIYWDFENLGRVDIPSGYRFMAGTTELLLREQRWQFSKAGGWILTGKAWEAT